MRQILNITIITFVIVIIIINFIPFALAAESSPSADIKSKLEELKKEIASKAAKLKQEVNRKLQDKAYVGLVKTKTDSSLTLAARSGAKIVNINQDTIFESLVKQRTKFSLKTLAEEDYIAALGDIDETQVLTAKKIVLLPKEEDTPKSFLWGQVIAISDNLITIKDRSLKNIAVSSPSSDLRINDFVILTGYLNKNGIFEAGFVYVIPQGGFLKPKKVATPSATVKPTSSAKVAAPSGKKR